MNGLINFKSRLQDYISRSAPGILSFLNLYCNLLYRSECLSLLFTSPSKLYQVVLTYYRGDVVSASYTFKLLFLSPLVVLLGESRPDLSDTLLDLAKRGRDEEFLEVLMKLLKEQK